MGVLAVKGLPDSSVHSCIRRRRPIAAREVVVVAAVAVAAAAGVAAAVEDIADNPDEVAGTWRRYLSKLFNPALRFVPDRPSLLEQPDCHQFGVRSLR